MTSLYSIGFDIHKKMIAYRIKALGGRLIEKGQIDAEGKSLGEWIFGLPGPWIAAMEAAGSTISSLLCRRGKKVAPRRDER